MQKRRKSSPNYPQIPQKNAHTKSGEKEEGYSKGHYSRDNTSAGRFSDRKGGFKGRKSGSGASFRSNRKPPERSRQQLPPITSDEQITDGKYRGQYLKVSTSPKMAPTKRSLREVMFRILYRRVRAKRFLDICAGAGTVGIDAVSRGALLVTMVERKAKNCSLIRENLEGLEIKEGHGELVSSEVLPFLKQMAKRRRYWDVVYFAPPFDFEYDEALEHFKRGVSIKPGGVFVIEHHAEMFFPERLGVLKRWKVVVEDDVAMSFYDRTT